MKQFSDFRGMLRTIGLNCLAAAPIICLFIFFSLPMFEKRFYQDRNDQTRIATEAVFNIATALEKDATAGKLTQEEAKSRALELIRSLRYNQVEYFWVNDLEHKMLMHPIKPELQGKDLSEFKDPQGKFLFREMVEVSKANGGGFVEYLWPKPGHQEPVRKVSYVQLFKPWGWVLGTGVYIDDVEAEVAAFKKKTLLGLAIAIFISICISVVSGILYANRIIKPIMEIAVKLREGIQGTSQLSRELGEVSSKVAASSQEQAAAVHETVTSMKRMSGIISETATSSQQSLEIAQVVNSKAQMGREILDRLSQAMESIQRTSEQLQNISGIVDEIEGKSKIINDIVFETRLLSFNASIESARAGHHGKGFAVISEEVGKLAHHSGKAASEINDLLARSQKQVGTILSTTQSSVDLALRTSQEATEVFHEIAQSIEVISGRMGEIASSAREQEGGLSQMTAAMTQLDQSAQINSGVAEEASRAAEELETHSHGFRSLVEKMKSITHSETEAQKRAA